MAPTSNGQETRVTEERFPIKSQDPDDFFCGVWFFPGSAIMMKRALFEKIGGFDSSLLAGLKTMNFSCVFLSWAGNTYALRTLSA